VDGKAAGVIEAKKEGVTLTGVETQSDKYTKGLPAGLPRWSKPLPFAYQSAGIETRSTNGLDPDASLYWLVRLLDGGADPRYLGRRLIRMASEDVALAGPRALRLALDAVATYERLGTPEGELALA